jgi:hypothetical protein
VDPISVVVIGFVLAGGLAAIALGKRAVRTESRFVATWRAYAEPRGLRVTPPSSNAEGGWPSMDGARDDVPIAFDVHYAHAGNPLSQVFTRVTSRAVVPAEVHVRVRPRAHAASAGFRTGDAAFDEAFAVQTSDATAAGKLLDDDARSALLAWASSPGMSLVYDHGEITLSWAVEETREHVLDAASLVVVAFARFRGAAGYR